MSFCPNANRTAAKTLTAIRIFARIAPKCSSFLPFSVFAEHKIYTYWLVRRATVKRRNKRNRWNEKLQIRIDPVLIAMSHLLNKSHTFWLNTKADDGFSIYTSKKVSLKFALKLYIRSNISIQFHRIFLNLFLNYFLCRRYQWKWLKIFLKLIVFNSPQWHSAHYVN